jgi:hypothetical protein
MGNREELKKRFDELQDWLDEFDKDGTNFNEDTEQIFRKVRDQLDNLEYVIDELSYFRNK